MPGTLPIRPPHTPPDNASPAAAAEPQLAPPGGRPPISTPSHPHKIIGSRRVAMGCSPSARAIARRSRPTSETRRNIIAVCPSRRSIGACWSGMASTTMNAMFGIEGGVRPFRAGNVGWAMDPRRCLGLSHPAPLGRRSAAAAGLGTSRHRDRVSVRDSVPVAPTGRPVTARGIAPGSASTGNLKALKGRPNRMRSDRVPGSQRGASDRCSRFGGAWGDRA